MTKEQIEFLRDLDIILFGELPMLGETPELEEKVVKWFRKEQKRLTLQKELYTEIQKRVKETSQL